MKQQSPRATDTNQGLIRNSALSAVKSYSRRMENIALVTIKVRPTPRPGKPSHPSKPNSVSKMAAMTLVAVKRCVTPTQPASKRHKPVRRGESRQPTLGVKMMSAGLAACWADMVTFPLDVAKVRLQVSIPRYYHQVISSLPPFPLQDPVKNHFQGRMLGRKAREKQEPQTFANPLPTQPPRGPSTDEDSQMKILLGFLIQGESSGAAALSVLAAGKRGTLNFAKSSAATTAGAAVNSFKYKGIVGTICTISKEEGPRALYNGLIPGLQRQLAFASMRIGFYDSVKQGYIQLFRAEGKVSNNNLGLCILSGITTGGLAVSVAQPTDVVKVRMQAQSSGPKRYTGSINAYKTIAANEGVRGLWKGVMPNICRNALCNAAELASYDIIKTSLLRRGLLSDSVPCHFMSAAAAGFIATVVSSPVDVVKTRFMNSPQGTYSGAVNCATRMYKEGGFRAFYKGFTPSFVRVGSWNIVMFMSYEQLKRILQNARDSGLPQAQVPQFSSEAPLKKFV